MILFMTSSFSGKIQIYVLIIRNYLCFLYFQKRNRISSMGCCSPKRFIMITVLLLIELVDLGLDWDFYIEVSSTEQDIQHKTELRYLILAFAVVGSITFIFELIGLRYDARKDYKHLTFSTALSMISTWLEDVPQIVLAVMIAIWSTELISKVQIAKAGIAIGEALVHIIISVWQLRFRDNTSYSKKTSCLKRMIILDLCGGVVILLCSVFLLLELKYDLFH